MYILGQAVTYCHSKLEKEYPGWANFLEIVYNMLDSVLAPEQP